MICRISVLKKKLKNDKQNIFAKRDNIAVKSICLLGRKMKGEGSFILDNVVFLQDLNFLSRTLTTFPKKFYKRWRRRETRRKIFIPSLQVRMCLNENLKRTQFLNWRHGGTERVRRLPTSLKEGRFTSAMLARRLIFPIREKAQEKPVLAAAGLRHFGLV